MIYGPKNSSKAICARASHSGALRSLTATALWLFVLTATAVGQNNNWPQTFQALNPNEVFVLGSNGNLWLEHAPFGSVIPPARHQVDGNVQTFRV